jgi:hypothetical protein
MATDSSVCHCRDFRSVKNASLVKSNGSLADEQSAELNALNPDRLRSKISDAQMDVSVAVVILRREYFDPSRHNHDQFVPMWEMSSTTPGPPAGTNRDLNRRDGWDSQLDLGQVARRFVHRLIKHSHPGCWKRALYF